jgi:hypothetical protein
MNIHVRYKMIFILNNEKRPNKDNNLFSDYYDSGH